MKTTNRPTTFASFDARCRRLQRRGVTVADSAAATNQIISNAQRVDWIGEREAGDYGRASGPHRVPAGKRALRHCVNIFYRGYGPLPA
mgnify:CR=1 FL=1